MTVIIILMFLWIETNMNIKFLFQDPEQEQLIHTVQNQNSPQPDSSLLCDWSTVGIWPEWTGVSQEGGSQILTGASWVRSRWVSPSPVATHCRSFNDFFFFF